MASRKKKKIIGILTGGGDCPGLNAVIRAVAKKLIIEHNAQVIGIKDGYEGLVKNRYEKLSFRDVSGILTLGGTILGTSNIANPYRYALGERGKIVFKDYSARALRTARRLGLHCLVCIGGDGTLSIAHRLCCDGLGVIGVPKTIDNDIRGTDITFGFDSAVQVATEGIDRIHTTAQSHHRIMIVEVMGRTAGWIALYAGVAGGGDIILIPEIPYDIHKIVSLVKERHKHGKRFSIIVVAEGARPKGGKQVIREIVEASTIKVRLGGIGFELARQLEALSGIETRTVLMGHLLRGGSPTAFDRILATRLGARAAQMVEQKRFGYMVGVRGDALCEVPLKMVARGSRTIPANHPLVKTARSIGTSFGI